MPAKGRLCGKAFADLGLVGIGQFLQILDRADLVEAHARRGELFPVEGRVRLEVIHLRAQTLFLDAAHLARGVALDLVPEAVVHLGGRILPPEAHSKFHVILHDRSAINRIAAGP